jgi:hypothetical protein
VALVANPQAKPAALVENPQVKAAQAHCRSAGGGPALVSHTDSEQQASAEVLVEELGNTPMPPHGNWRVVTVTGPYREFQLLVVTCTLDLREPMATLTFLPVPTTTSTGAIQWPRGRERGRLHWSGWGGS